jgi:hypothetical protein
VVIESRSEAVQKRDGAESRASYARPVAGTGRARRSTKQSFDLFDEDPREGVTALGRSARKQRNRFGTEITHCRTGTGGMTWSTRCAAVCAIRRPLQEGQTPRPLHEKATTKPWPEGGAIRTRGWSNSLQRVERIASPSARVGHGCLALITVPKPADLTETRRPTDQTGRA